ncbi:MAG: AAA family ATPase [Bdellovibrionota bacterium]
MDVKEIYQHIDQVGHEDLSLKGRWLIDSLWLSEAVGLIGGPPKSCKSWLAIDMAVSTASATKCLQTFNVLNHGPVLVYLAEDSLAALKERVAGICKNRGLNLATLPLFTITLPSMRLDKEPDQLRLRQAISKVGPRLVVLDPLVRLHRSDENNAKEMSAILSYLRDLQREYHTAIVLVHHATKRSHERAGLSLRGSSDLHAFGDSNLYLFKKRDLYELTIEHRSAANIDPLALKLEADDEIPPHLIVTNPPQETSTASLEESIVEKLNQQNPVMRTTLRQLLKVNNARLGDALVTLEKNNQILKGPNGWLLPKETIVPCSTL